MIRLVCGRAGSGKSEYIYNKIKENAAAGIRGQILLVPEQLSFAAERRLCETGGDGICLFAEVMTYKSLARRVFCELGGGAGAPLDEGGRLAAMYLAASRVKDKLSLYARTSRPQLIKKLLSAVTELKSRQISPEDLMGAVQGEDGLSQKLSELSLVYSAYDAVMTGDLCDPEDVFQRLYRGLQTGVFQKGRMIWADGFNGFTPAELSVIGALAAHCDELCITLCLDPRGGDDAFLHTENTGREIGRLARSIGVRVKYEAFSPEAKRFFPAGSGLSVLEKKFHDYGAAGAPGAADGSVSLYSASGAYAECEVAAARIKALAAAGTRYRDICVATRDLPGYAPFIAAVFRKYGLPFFMDMTDDISSKPPVLAVCAALDTVRRGFDCADVIRLAKTGLAGISRDEADLLENYALVWNLRGKGWYPEGGFAAHPDGYAREFDADAKARLLRLDEIRAALIGPLLRFKAAAKDAGAAGLCAALYEYLVEIGLPGAMEERREALSGHGAGLFSKPAERLRAAAQYDQIWEIICGVLDQCVLILGDEKLPFDEFAELFRLMLAGGRVGSIPTTLDCVTVGQAGRMRPDRPKHLFVLNAADGVFPKRIEQDGLFTETEKRRLFEDAGLKVGPGEEELALREQLEVYQTLFAPSVSLTLSFPRSGANGAAVSPSYIILRIKRLFPEIRVLDGEEDGSFRTWAPRPCAELGAGGEGDLSAAARAAALKTGEGAGLFERAERAALGLRGPIAPGTANALYGADPPVSATRLEGFNTCRFLYYAKWGLRAKPRRRADFDPALSGSMVHYVLEKAAGEIFAPGSDWKKISGGEILALVEKYSLEYADAALSGLSDKSERFVYLYERLKAQLFAMLSDMVLEFMHSLFVPVSFESALPSGAVSLSFEGRELPLSGQVDRIDVYEKGGKRYIRVADYKTGGKKLDYGEIDSGLGLQLLLYLFALADGENSLPAGALYIPALKKIARVEPGFDAEKYGSVRGDIPARSGIVVDDPEILLAMEDVPPGENPRFIPVGFKGEAGKREVRGRSAAALSPERLELLRAHVSGALHKMREELLGGAVECSPYAKGAFSACDRCDYLLLCQFDRTRRGDRLRPVAPMGRDKFFARLEGAEKSGENTDGGEAEE